MKKLYLILPLAIFLFSAIILVMSCEEEEEDNPFIGTWEADSKHINIFTNTTITNYRPNGDLYWKATYTYNDTHIFVKLDPISEDEVFYPLGAGKEYPLEYYFIGKDNEYFEEGTLMFANVPLTKIN